MQEIQETQVQSLDQEDTLEEGMQPTPVFLPGESHGRPWSVGSQKVGHDSSDLARVHAL